MEKPPDDQWGAFWTFTGIGAALGIIFGLARYVIEAEYGSVKTWVRSVVAAVCVGVVVAWGMESMTWAVTMKACAIAVATYIAPSLLHALVVLGHQMSVSPFQFIRDVIASLKGGARLPPDNEERK